MKLYEDPKVEIQIFNVEDVITTSCPEDNVCLEYTDGCDNVGEWT